jgi:hypothetical protein
MQLTVCTCRTSSYTFLMFSFFHLAGWVRGQLGRCEGLTSVGLSNSESKPDNVAQCGLDHDTEERVEDLTLKNCINTGIQPKVSAGGSTRSRDRPNRIKGLWGNFTWIARRTSNLASRENTALSSSDIANLRAGDALAKVRFLLSQGWYLHLSNIKARYLFYLDSEHKGELCSEGCPQGGNGRWWWDA